MKTGFFEELFEYSHQKNLELIDVFENNQKSIPRFSASLFSHILNAHQIWNFRILQKTGPFGVWQGHDIFALAKINKDNLKCSQRILKEFEAECPVTYKNSKGDSFNDSVKDILFHIINHSTYHRGQIAMDFRQNDLEPLVTDYIFYKH